jgi:hypothetical protein
LNEVNEPNINKSGKKDRYKLHQFYQGEGSGPEYFPAQQITEEVYRVHALKIATLSMDFLGATNKQRKKLEADWIDIIPSLDNVTILSVRHRVNQNYFEAICKMKNLEKIYFWTSTVESLNNIANLKKLDSLGISSFSRLSDISPILSLKNLTHLSIDSSFKIENYEIIGDMHSLIGLRLNGDCTAPKNLRLQTLKPFKSLKNLKHLDLSCASVIDKSYDTILDMTSLERFDTHSEISKSLREKIKSNHKTLKAGFFMDWDFENKRIYEGKEW